MWVLLVNDPLSDLRQWFDKLHRGAQNDLATLQGFVCAVRDCLRIKQGGYLHGGHPCNGCLGQLEFIFVCSDLYSY